MSWVAPVLGIGAALVGRAASWGKDRLLASRGRSAARGALALYMLELAADLGAALSTPLPVLAPLAASKRVVAVWAGPVPDRGRRICATALLVMSQTALVAVAYWAGVGGEGTGVTPDLIVVVLAFAAAGHGLYLFLVGLGAARHPRNSVIPPMLATICYLMVRRIGFAAADRRWWAYLCLVPVVWGVRLCVVLTGDRVAWAAASNTFIQALMTTLAGAWAFGELWRATPSTLLVHLACWIGFGLGVAGIDAEPVPVGPAAEQAADPAQPAPAQPPARVPVPTMGLVVVVAPEPPPYRAEPAFEPPPEYVAE